MAEQNNQLQKQTSTSIEVEKTTKQLFADENVKNKFAEMLGKKAPGFISSVISVSNSPALIGAKPMTILSAASVAATLDLPINPNLGFAYIVAYNDKKLGKQAQFQMGYKGFIQLAMRSGQYQTVNATDVREGELLEEDLLSGEIKFKKLPADKRVKAKVIGYAAYFRLLNGFEKTLYMSKEDIEAHAYQYSSSYKSSKDGVRTKEGKIYYPDSLWKSQFDTMAKKTVIKLLISKFGPLSIEMQTAQKFDQAVIPANINVTEVPIEDVEVQYIDNEDDEQPQTESQAPISMTEAMARASEEFKNEKKETPTTELL